MNSFSQTLLYSIEGFPFYFHLHKIFYAIKYDHQLLSITNITKDDKRIKLEYADAIREIKRLLDYGKTKWVGKEKDNSFHGALNAIY